MAHKLKVVAIIAPTGMLGSGVYSILKDKYKLVLVYRDEKKVELLQEKYGYNKNIKFVNFDLTSIIKNSANFKKLTAKIGKIDAIINCAGIINKYADQNLKLTFFINSVIPQLLSKYYREKLIQITTDCVFDGQKNFPYDEKAAMSAFDAYGMSKWLGEPCNSLVLRTSIIGNEIATFSSLLEWFKKQNGKTINGYNYCYWNGITSQQFGKVCDQIISHRKSFPRQGTYHIFSTTLSKYEILTQFKKKYKLNIKITKDTKIKCNRALSTVHNLNRKLKIPSFEKMLNELE